MDIQVTHDGLLKADFIKLRNGKSITLKRRKYPELCIGVSLQLQQRFTKQEKVHVTVQRCVRWWLIKLVPV